MKSYIWNTSSNGYNSNNRYPTDLQRLLGPIWYMCLKTENCCLKTFVEIRMSEKVR